MIKETLGLNTELIYSMQSFFLSVLVQSFKLKMVNKTDLLENGFCYTG